MADLPAQNKANNHWIFGNNIRLDFSGGVPRASVIDSFVTYEAAASISDPRSGNLLLYSNGTDVFNGLLQQINGDKTLFGNQSSTQGALIMPESCNRYYVFTSDAGEYEGVNVGVHYTLVDITMLNGRGGLVPDFINVPMLDQAAEKLTAAPHADGRSFWVLAHGMRDGKFHAFHVSQDGVQPPVVSDVGFPHGSGRSTDGVGAMKFSPDGKKLALAMFTNEKIELYDFNNQTGDVHSRVDLGQALESYGVEFSPDSRKLYVSTVHERNNASRLFQYDLDAPDIRASRLIVYETREDLMRLSGMQLGPDNKIYIARLENEFIQIINQPNRRGRNCDLTEMQLPFGARCGLGIMNLYTCAPVNLIEPNANDLVVSEDATICPGQSVQLTAENAFGGSFQWSPREGLSDPNSQSPTAAPQRTTTYIISVESNCGDDTDSVTVFVRPVPEMQVEPVGTICPGESVQLLASGADEVRWEPATGLSDPTIVNPMASPNETTTYTVIGRFADGCESRAEVTVRVFPGPGFDLGPDQTICEGQTLRLRAGGGITYRWWPDIEISATDVARPTVSPTQSRTYFVEVIDDVGCSKIDSIQVLVGAGLSLPGNGELDVCAGESILLDIGGPDGDYRWTPAEGLDDPTLKQPTASPTRDITYRVRLNSTCGQSTGEVRVTVKELPEYALVDLQSCEGLPLALNPNAAPDLTYAWDADQGIEDLNAANPQIIASAEQYYYVTISNGGCAVRDSVKVSLSAAPELELSLDAEICAGSSVQLRVSGADQYIWSPDLNIDDVNSANPTVSPGETTRYYVRGLTGADCERLDSVTVTVNPAPVLRLGPIAPRICAGESIQVVSPDDVNLRSVRWSPAAGLSDPNILNPRITLSNSQVYTVEYEYATGCRGEVEYRVEVSAPPTVRLDEPFVQLCEGEVLTVRASGADEYSWFDAAGELIGTGEAREVKHDAGRIRIVGRNAAFCRDTVELVVQNLGRPDLQAQADYVVCYGDTVALEALGAERYEWSPADDLADPNAATTLAWPLLNTTYTLRGFNANNCEVVQNVNVRLVPRVDILLAAESPEGGALPGDEIICRLDFALREELRELLDQRAFSVVVEHGLKDMRVIPNSILRLDGLPSWEFGIENVDEPGRFRITGVSSDSAPLEKRFALEFRMQILLTESDTEYININVISSDFGAKVVCGDLDSATVRLSRFCLRSHRGVLSSGTQFALLQNQPNPARAATEVLYRLGFETNVSLQLTDNLGRVIRELVDERQASGVYRIQLNTSELAAGSYRYTLRAGPFTESHVLLVE